MSSAELPEIDFATFLMSLVHSAWIHLGQVPHPERGEHVVDLPLARQAIDLVGLIEVKTKGNLTGDEERLLGEMLYELRRKYVELSKAQS